MYRRLMTMRLRGASTYKIADLPSVDSLAAAHSSWRKSPASGRTPYLEVLRGKQTSNTSLAIGGTFIVVLATLLLPFDVPALGPLLILAASVFVIKMLPDRGSRAMFINALHRPVTTDERAQLIPNAGSLADAYWPLVTAVEALAARSPEVLDSLDDAMNSIDEAIMQFEAEPIQFARSPEALISEAGALDVDAANETDQVVAASLIRRADALRTQAKVLERAATIERRNRVLEQEVIAQIEAMRASVVHYGKSMPEARTAFEALAENVRQMAVEAASISAAREEVNETLRISPVTQLQTQR